MLISVDTAGDWTQHTSESCHNSNPDTEMLGTVTIDGITKGLLYSKQLKRYYAAGYNKQAGHNTLDELPQNEINRLLQ